jgi:hypothetical protein
MMKTPLRFGLIITAGVVAWTIIAHLLIKNPESRVHSIGTPVFFNLLQFAGIYFGIRARERELGQKPIFKDALKTGISISFVYAVASSLFFLLVVLFVGTSLLAAEPGTRVLPKWLLLVQAFTGLFLGAMLFGLVYSTVIGFALARRQSQDHSPSG